MSRLNNVERELRMALDAYRSDRNRLAREGHQLEAANADKCLADGYAILRQIKQAQRDEIARVKEIIAARMVRPYSVPRDIGTPRKGYTEQGFRQALTKPPIRKK